MKKEGVSDGDFQAWGVYVGPRMITDDLRGVLQGRPQQTQVKVLIDPTPGGVDTIRQRLDGIGVGYREIAAGGQTVFQTTLNRNQIQSFANMNAVERVDHAPTFQPLGAVNPRQSNPDADITAVTTRQTGDLIDIEEAWEAGNRGAGAKVGIIDAPVDVEHPAYADNIAAVGGPEGKSPHGTWVAGCIAADEYQTERGTVRGMAPDCELYVHGALKGGAAGVGDIIEAIGWCIEQGVDIINMSFGGAHSEVLQTTTAKAHDNGIVPVAAAGNSGPSAGTVSCPAHHEEPIAVAAVGSDGNAALYSSQGPGWNGISKPDVSAYGGDADIDGGQIVEAEAVISTGPNDSSTALIGTSMAAPHVAGMVAVGAGASE